MEDICFRFFNPNDPKFDIIIEKSTHMNLSHLTHEFVQLSDFDKLKPLKMLVREYRKHSSKHKTSCIVFCNSISSARAVAHTISEMGIKCSSLHGEIPPRTRFKNYMDFRKRKTQILVATDLASRGLDMPFVSHIINFDFPKSASDYLHRAGRAGRAGKPGIVLSLYRQHDMPLLEEMRLS